MNPAFRYIIPLSGAELKTNPHEKDLKDWHLIRQQPLLKEIRPAPHMFQKRASQSKIYS